jgi:RNA polymerase sigma factor (sigma-70 family)
LPEGHSVIHIVQSCAKADRESQKTFYKMYYGFSMAICMRYCNTKDDAMEVVNDGFMKIYRELHNFKPAYDNYETSLRGWMKSIMVNTAIDHFRKNNKKNFLVDIKDDHLETIDPQETSINKLSYKEIIEIVQRLSPGYRTVFNLYVIDGYKHEEIAKQLNITVGTSKSNLAKAKMNIQKMLKETEQNYYEQKAV